MQTKALSIAYDKLGQPYLHAFQQLDNLAFHFNSTYISTSDTSTLPFLDFVCPSTDLSLFPFTLTSLHTPFSTMDSASKVFTSSSSSCSLPLVTTYSTSLTPAPQLSTLFPSSTSNTYSTYSLTTKSFSHPKSLHDTPNLAEPSLSTYVVLKKKYKPVAQKIYPIIGEVPEHFRIVCNIKGDLLTNMPPLFPHPPLFTPTGRYTLKRCNLMDRAHSKAFLLPAEHDLLHHFVSLHNKAFAWDNSEHGHF